MEPNLDGTEVLETTVETVEETVETPEAPTAEEIAELREKASKLEDFENKNKQLFERNKKLEEKAKGNTKVTGNLSQKDVLYLAKADINEEDMDEVTELAALKKIPVSEAHQYMKPILDVRNEERRTAAATHTRGSGRGTSNVSGTDLLAAAERGEEVDLNDGDNAEKLFQARLQRKVSKFKRK